MNYEFITLKHKLKINIKDYLIEGKLYSVKLGQTKSQLSSLLPEPDFIFDGTGKTSNDPADLSLATTHFSANVWGYGGIRLNFNEDHTLGLIIIDYSKGLNGGDQLSLDHWVLENPISLIKVQTILNQHSEDYDKRTSKTLDCVYLTLVRSHIRLTFCPTINTANNKTNIDDNEYILAAISLAQKGSIYDMAIT